MYTNETKIRKGEKGFTLVELAIVMIIIGLLITGILKGQEMIANAQITATISGMKGLDAAANTFRDSYNSFPGDMANASGANARLPNCLAPCGNGDGDGRLDTNPGALPVAGGEMVFFFTQLSAADLISGLTADGSGGGGVEFGDELPTAPIGGGFSAGHTNPNGGPTAATGFNAATLRTGHYLTLNGAVAAVGATTGSLSPTQAARIDRKMDDGVPGAGSIQGSAGGTCIAGGLYAEGDSDALCAIMSRIGG